jgi:hypothetical protein
MTSIGRTIIGQITGALFQNESKGLVRLFETEYQKDYRHAIKSGAVIDDEFVRQFLGNNIVNH